MPRAKPTLENIGSLITYHDAKTGQQHCLGFLFHAAEHGTFDADFGQVDVSKADADTHNNLLSAALIEGLDKCEIGQCGMFYLNTTSAHRLEVRTFTGEVVSSDVAWRGSDVVMTRNGRQFRGRRRKDVDLIMLKRIS